MGFENSKVSPVLHPKNRGNPRFELSLRTYARSSAEGVLSITISQLWAGSWLP